MRIAVISDVHANLEALHAVLSEIDKLAVDETYHLGDIVGYYTDPNECVDILREREITTIMGNHDAVACGLEDPLFFRSAAKKAALWTGDQLRNDVRDYLQSLPEERSFNGSCLGVHGSPACRDNYIIDWLDASRQIEYLNGRSVNICFFGHSHRAAMFSERGADLSIDVSPSQKLHPDMRYMINPGSVGQPRDKDSRAAFCVLDTDSLVVDFHRVEYDIEKTSAKLHNAGLPSKLARRLHDGR